MAETKKNETKKNEAVEPTIDAVEPTIDIEAIKAEIRAEVESEILKEVKKDSTSKAKGETRKQIEYANEEVEIFIPFLHGGDGEEDLTVTINGYTWQIKRGMNHKLPRKVAEVIRNSNEQQYAAYQFMEKAKEEQYD